MFRFIANTSNSSGWIIYYRDPKTNSIKRVEAASLHEAFHVPVGTTFRELIAKLSL